MPSYITIETQNQRQKIALKQAEERQLTHRKAIIILIAIKYRKILDNIFKMIIKMVLSKF